jgi:hypothetical protein
MPGPGPKFNGIRADRKGVGNSQRLPNRQGAFPGLSPREGPLLGGGGEIEAGGSYTCETYSSVIDVRYYHDMKRWYILEDKRREYCYFSIPCGEDLVTPAGQGVLESTVQE